MSDQLIHTPEQQKATEWAFEFTQALVGIHEKTDPKIFGAFFMGGIVANVIGNIEDDYWEKMISPEPCEVPNRKCHNTREEYGKILQAIRDSWKAKILKVSATN